MENQESQENKAGIFALICSVLFPIVGIICYFVNNKKVSNASSYLIAAGIGFVISIIIQSVAPAMK